jgi:DNA helicase-2/ATP-dependent DNA helicase PcrA
MKNDIAFGEAYTRLNTEQKRAVDTIEGPVFVIAGPGTGKTQVLTLRIANILRSTDTPPESILALTFTESGASEMRARLEKIIGSTAWKVRIHTFHGFAESVISKFPDSFPRIVGAFVATDIERAEILEAALERAKVTHLRPYGDPMYYHGIIAHSIQTLKREKVTPDDLRVRIVTSEKEFDAMEGKVHEKGKYVGKMKGEFITMQKKIEKTRDLLAVYEEYETGLTAAHRYDFEDLILEVEKALTSDESLRLQVQESLLYILADEHQDANRAQNALLEIVSGFFDTPNLFIVGDEKQAIYRFQGADLDSVHYFKTRYPNTEIIALIENYRSTQSILDASLSLIMSSPDTRLSRVSLIAKSTHAAKPITLVACPDPETEMAELASRIQDCLKAGTLPKDIAVLVRRNQDASYVAESLAALSIQTTGAGESNALHNRFVIALLRLLTFIESPRDEHAQGIFTLPGFPLGAADVWRITQEARKSKQPILSVLASEESRARANLSDGTAAEKLAVALGLLIETASFERPAVIAEEALRASGLLPKMLAASDRTECLAAVRSLLRMFEDLARREHDVPLSRALELIRLYEDRGIQLSMSGGESEARVKIMTAHRAKGREFGQVFIPRLTESAWSTRSRAEHFYVPDILSGAAELEDERRLLYVAITRAKVHATLSYAVLRDSGRADAPSALIEDLDPLLVEQVVSTIEAVDPLTKEKLPRVPEVPSSDDLETLRAAFYAQGLSPTAFNNYLECTWKYFYVNLLRIPEPENKFMLYGSAIHDALKKYADARLRGSDIGADGLIQAFTTWLSRAPLRARDIIELEEKGTRSLTTWWHENYKTWPERSQAEVPVLAYLEDANAPDGRMVVRGNLDRIDEVGGGVRVIDYKTGKAKSRNELMGETKDADGNYYRQLTFYKMLLARTEQPQHMVDGVLEFVEPNETGETKSETFEITDGEVKELEVSILEAVKAITTLAFWNDPCDTEDCPWCALRFG